MRVLRLVFIEFLLHISQLVCTISLSVFPSEIIANSSAYRKWLIISIISWSSVYTLKSICVNHYSFYTSQSAFFDLIVLHFNLLLWFLMQCHLLLVFLNILFNQILRLIVPYVAGKYTNTALFFFIVSKLSSMFWGNFNILLVHGFSVLNQAWFYYYFFNQINPLIFNIFIITLRIIWSTLYQIVKS